MADDAQDVKEILRRIEERQKRGEEPPSVWRKVQGWAWALILAGTLANGAANIQGLRRIGHLERQHDEIHQKATTCTDNFTQLRAWQPAQEELMTLSGEVLAIKKTLLRGSLNDQELSSIRDTLLDIAKRVTEIGQQPRTGPVDDAKARYAEERINYLIEQYSKWMDERRRREKLTGEKLSETADTIDKSIKAVAAVGKFARNVRPLGSPRVTVA